MPTNTLQLIDFAAAKDFSDSNFDNPASFFEHLPGKGNVTKTTNDTINRVFQGIWRVALQGNEGQDFTVQTSS